MATFSFGPDAKLNAVDGAPLERPEGHVVVANRLGEHTTQLSGQLSGAGTDKTVSSDATLGNDGAGDVTPDILKPS